ncbi:MAG: tryptophan 7-halogenase [Cellvibrio sp.]|uniref:tryptophan halogenase family protein n=1 Tax=Cellvibrio sp. TaxID=1965322 RepID=UPI0027244749|nr:tryptophan 7-halogenase [Cellvibrio sp.]
MAGKKMKLVIAGGGTAGWITAAALAHQMGEILDITLVESQEIGTIGVGEATIPPMRTFHRFLGINEQEFMRATNATFKLGIQFENWRQIGEKYFHSFGVTGKQTIITDFIHFWLRGRELGIASEFGDYCLEYKAALKNRFSLNEHSKINYAFHLDAGRYASFLRARAEARGVTRVEGKIASVQQHPDTGFIVSLTLESGQEIAGDLFIDCTGMRGLLIEQCLQTGFEEWDHWLPCDSAIAVQTESHGPAVPYTKSIAHHAGWRWQIPLQHRVGNGIVFSGSHLSDDEATNMLLSSMEGKVLTEPRVIKFKTGRRKKSWNKNCIAMGLASGFLEPLESTSIHMIMTAVTRLLQLFPHGEIKQSIVDEYNTQAKSEYERIRDFIILHYKATERDDSPFWRYCKEMEIPSDLKHRIALFKDFGRSNQVEGELFRLDSWTQVMLGQGIMPSSYHPIVGLMSDRDLQNFLNSIAADVDKSIAMMSTHHDFVNKYGGVL